MNSTNYFSYELKIINFYCPLSFILIGIFLNIITAKIFNKNPFKNTNLGLLNQCLSLIDVFSLSVAFAVYFSASIDNDVQTLNYFTCKFFNIVKRFFIKLSSWTQVLITLDRVSDVLYPNRFHAIKKRKNVLIILFVMCTILGFIFIADGLYNIEEGKKIIKNQTTITHACNSLFIPILVSDTTSLLFRTVIPFTIIAISNIVMVRKLRQSKFKVYADKKLKKENQFTFIVIFLNAIFLISQVPLSAINVWRLLQHFLKFDQFQLDEIKFLYNISFMLVYLYESSQFVINMVFNRIFRRIFFKKFICKKPSKNQSISNIKLQIIKIKE